MLWFSEYLGSVEVSRFESPVQRSLEIDVQVGAVQMHLPGGSI